MQDSQLLEAGGRKITIKGESTAESQSAHHCEACCVHEGVLALVVLTKPGEGYALKLLRNNRYLNPR